jgi:CRP-like cAMP-binding protein
LTKEALAKALEPYPKIAQSISMMAEQRYANHIKKKENAVVDEFGDELLLAITQQELQNVSIFKDASIGFLHCLAMSLKPLKYFRNQIVFRKGDSANAMYFVAKGTAEAVDETGSIVYAKFPPASFFGEVGLFLENQKRTATIQCSSDDMLLFTCDKTTIDKLLKEFPEVQGKITSELERRMEYIKHREQSKLSPDQMQATEIESVRQKLQSISLFKGAALGFVHSLAVDVKVSRYNPGAVICKEGELAESMYFIVDGIVQIVGKGGEVFAESGTNTYFGEVSLLYDITRTATVKSKTETTILELGKKALESALVAYPSAESSLREVAKEHYERHLKRKQASQSQASLLSKTEHTIPERLKKVCIT